jgi:hypothetical protein
MRLPIRQTRDRFVFSDVEQDKSYGGPFAIITNVAFFHSYESEIKQWCTATFGEYMQHSVIIDFRSRDDLIMFKLRWAL